MPAVLIMKKLLNVNGLIWVQPVTDVLSLIIVFIMLQRKIESIEI